MYRFHLNRLIYSSSIALLFGRRRSLAVQSASIVQNAVDFPETTLKNLFELHELYSEFLQETICILHPVHTAPHEKIGVLLIPIYFYNHPKYVCIRLSNNSCASFNAFCMAAFDLSICSTKATNCC